MSGLAVFLLRTASSTVSTWVLSPFTVGFPHSPSSLAYMHHTPSASWKYSNTASGEWFAPSADDSTWVGATPTFFSPIESTVMTRYYRATVIIPTSFDGISAYEVGAYTKYGYIVYVNGQEVLRANLPETVEESTPCSSVSESAEYRRVSLPIQTLPTTGSVTIAIAIHFDSDRTSSIVDEFKGFFTLVAAGSSRGFLASFETDHPSSLPSESHEKAFDVDRRTKWSSSTLPVYNMAVFNGRQFINAYSVMSSGGLADRRPTQWTLSASNDQETWVVLDKKDHMHFTDMYQTKTFTLPHNAAAYTYYKFNFEASEGTNLEVGRIELFAADVAYAQTPVLAYDAAAFDFFVGQTVELAPTAGGFHDFQITGTLPAGLAFSTATGMITGTATTAAASASFQITAQHASTATTSYTATVAIAVDACDSAKTRFDVVKHDTGLGSAERWELYSGETLIAAHAGRDVFQSQSKGDETFPFCAAPGTFKLVLLQAFKRGWVNSAYIDVFVYADAETKVKVLHAINLLSEEKTEVTFNTLLLSNADMTQWKYKADGSVPANWYASSFSEAWDAVPATRPTVSHSVWLFRRSITVTSIAGFMGFEMRTLSRAGVVVYLNGQEVHRANVNGDVTGTSTSTATTTTSEWRTFTERVGAGHLIAGENVFAVAVVNKDSAATPLDTVITIRFLTEKGLTLGLDTTVFDLHHNNADSLSENMFHGDYSKRHISTASENHLITATFNHGDRHFVNMYCIVGPWNALENAPKAWTVEVSNDGSSFTQVSAFNEEHFDVLYERKCYVLPAVTAPMRAMRFHFTAIVDAASSNLQINAIDLYMIDAAQLALAETPYAASTTVTWNLGEKTVLRPAHEYFTQCTALAPFPTGMTVRSNGVVFGAPTIASQPGAYQMRCTTAASQEVTATLQIGVVPCDGSRALLRFTATNLDDAGHRMVVVVTDATGTPVWYDYDMPKWAISYERAVCVENSVFTFALIDRTNEGWKASYTIWINNEQVATGTVPVNASPKYVVASAIVFVEQGEATVEYSVANSEPPAQWYKKETVRNWSQGTVGSLESVQGITSYYCLTFTAVIHELFISYLMGIRTSGGFIAYLNGQEINRVRMPDGAVTKDTTATETGSSEFVVAGYSMFTSALVDGENFLCVEVHKRSVRSETNDFDVYVTPQGDARELLVGGTVARSHEGFDSNYWHETWDKVFDKNTNTKFYSDDDDCSNVWFEYTLPNQRKEWVSRAEIWKGNGLTRNPSSLRIQASNTPTKKDSWETLGFMDAIKWTVSGYGEKKTMNFLPSKPYRAFRLVANGCDKEGIEIGEWLMFSAEIEAGYCRGGNGIESVLNGKVAAGPCDEGYVGQRSYQCRDGEFIPLGEDCKNAPPSVFSYPEKEYNLETRMEVSIKPTVDGRNLEFTSLPKMPDGLTLNPTTGEISGKPKSPQVKTKYIIMAANEGGSVSTDVTITITRAKLPIWLWIVIVVVAVAVIGGIVWGIIAIVKKKQEARKKHVKRLPKAAPKGAPKSASKAPAKPEAAPSKPKIAV